MPKIELPPHNELTEEVRKAIAKKLEEIEKQDAVKPGTDIQMNPKTAAWTVQYKT